MSGAGLDQVRPVRGTGWSQPLPSPRTQAPTRLRGRWSWRPLCGAGAREPGSGRMNFLCCCALGDGEPWPSHSSAVRHPAPRGRGLGPGPTGQKPRCGPGCVSPEAPGKSPAQVHSVDGRIQVPGAIGLRPVSSRLSLEVTSLLARPCPDPGSGWVLRVACGLRPRCHLVAVLHFIRAAPLVGPPLHACTGATSVFCFHL